MIELMSAKTFKHPLTQAARTGRHGRQAQWAWMAACASTAMVGGCASGASYHAPLQFDLRGPISPAAATVLAPSESPRVYADAEQTNTPPMTFGGNQAWIQGDRRDPTVLLAFNQAPAAAADSSLLAGGF